MKHVRLLLFVLPLFIVSLPAACPVWYIEVGGYIQFKGDNVTKKELYDLNLSDIKDTSDQALEQYKANYYYVRIHRASEAESKYIGYGYAHQEEGITVEQAFRKMMDTLMPTLNLQDTVFVDFELLESRKTARNQMSKEELGKAEDIYMIYSGFSVPRIKQRFVISSQAVVDLKRNPNGMGVVAYPSPATDYVSIKFDIREPKPGHLQLINSLGQEIASVDRKNLMEPYSFDLKGEPAGTYFIRAQIDGENFLRKFIKE